MSIIDTTTNTTLGSAALSGTFPDTALVSFTAPSTGLASISANYGGDATYAPSSASLPGGVTVTAPPALLNGVFNVPEKVTKLTGSEKGSAKVGKTYGPYQDKFTGSFVIRTVAAPRRWSLRMTSSRSTPST